MEISGDMKTFSKYVSFNVLGMVGMSAYILADTLFVANGIGESGITALNLALPIFTVITGLGLLLGMGGATWYAILQAQNKQDEATMVFNHSLLLAGILSLLIVLLGLFGSETLSQWLGADHETFAMTNTYLKVTMLFSPFFIYNNMLVAFIRNDRNPKLATGGMLLGSLANIILDYLFIFPMGMGMFGAALATGATPILSLLLLTLHFRTDYNSFRLKKIKVKLSRFVKIITLGISAFITEISSGVVMLVFNMLILGLTGNTGVAAYGIIANIAMISIAIFTGVAQGIQPIVSHLYGLRKIKANKRILTYSFMTTLGISVVIYVIIGFGSDQLIGFFNRDNNLALTEIARSGLLIYFIGMFFAGFNIVATASLSAIEQAGAAFRFSLIRSIVLIIPTSILFAHFFDMTGIWFSFVVTEVITSSLIIWRLYRSSRIT